MPPQQQVASEVLNQEYLTAIGSVVNARRLHDDACEAHGESSPQATETAASLQSILTHRDEVRVRYDAASRRSPAER
jgi:hypothetical protein